MRVAVVTDAYGFVLFTDTRRGPTDAEILAHAKEVAAGYDRHLDPEFDWIQRPTVARVMELDARPALHSRIAIA